MFSDFQLITLLKKSLLECAKVHYADCPSSLKEFSEVVFFRSRKFLAFMMIIMLSLIKLLLFYPKMITPCENNATQASYRKYCNFFCLNKRE